VVDFIKQVCAGSFYVKLKNEKDENDIIEIKNGRFDLICTEPIGD
jgi:ribosomal protein L33